jgi:membrane-associated protease RseP (regulator of RpoE activity)
LDITLLTHTILPFAGILLALLVIHEAGHYITAKMFGVKVLEAGIGLPPRLWGFRWHETDYTINAIPVGAFVRMLGEEDPSDPQSLAAQPKWKRTTIIGAGVFMNLALAITLFALSLMIPHKVSLAGARIVDVAPGSSAQAADLKSGDEIVSVNGRQVENQGDAVRYLLLAQGSNVDLKISRSNARTGSKEILSKSVYSRWNPGTYTDTCGVKHSQGAIGVTVSAAHSFNVNSTQAERAQAQKDAESQFGDYKKQIPPGSPAACYAGGQFGFRGLTAEQCAANLDGASQAEAEALKARLFAETDYGCMTFSAPAAAEVPTETRSEAPWVAFPDGARLSYESLVLTRNQVWKIVRGFGGSPVTGPVGIAQATGEIVDQAGWQSLIEFAATISMSLALINALPIPMVDGGESASPQRRKRWYT